MAKRTTRSRVRVVSDGKTLARRKPTTDSRERPTHRRRPHISRIEPDPSAIHVSAYGAPLSPTMGAAASTAAAGGKHSLGADANGAVLREDPLLAVKSYPRLDSSRTIALSDGRTLSYTEYGYCASSSPPNTSASPGRPSSFGPTRHATAVPSAVILFLHGTPGTRFFWHPAHTIAAREARTRVIVPERPGFGLSSPVLPFGTRTLLSYADDLFELLDALGLSNNIPSSTQNPNLSSCPPLYVVGYSAGGPYALALAHAIGQRRSDRKVSIAGVAVVSSLSPPVLQGELRVTDGMSLLSRFGYMLSRRSPILLRAVLKNMAASVTRSRYDAVSDDNTEEENSVFASDIELRRLMGICVLELYGRPHGVTCESEEYVLFAKDWGFQLADLPRNLPVYVYAGEGDIKCTPNMYRVIRESCPNVAQQSHIAKGKGHFYFYELFPSILEDFGLGTT